MAYGKLWAVQLRTGVVGKTGLQRMANAARFGLKQATVIVATDSAERARRVAYDYDQRRNSVQVLNDPPTGLTVLMPAPRW